MPGEDWLRVKIGEKTAFRMPERDWLGSRLVNQGLPTPVVAYARINRAYDHALMVLEGHRLEPVILIEDDPDALAREGYESYDHFRRYWRKRRGGLYTPAELVHVWEVRPWEEESDFEEMGKVLLQRVYGEFYGSLKPGQLQS